MRIFDEGQTLYELTPNQTTAPQGAIRSCAISSLILQVLDYLYLVIISIFVASKLHRQATLVFNGWNTCGLATHTLFNFQKQSDK